MEFLTVLLGYTGPNRDVLLMLGSAMMFAAVLWRTVHRQRLELDEHHRHMRDELREELERLREKVEELEARNALLERAVRQHGLSI